MFIFPPSGLGCDLEFGFSSFGLENPLICVYNKNFRSSGDCQAARSLSDCCGRSKQRRQARGAPNRSSIHTFSARAPSRRAVFSRFPRSTTYTRFNSQSGGVCTVRRRCRETAAVRRAQKSASLFSGALAISLFISVVEHGINLHMVSVHSLSVEIFCCVHLKGGDLNCV